MSHEEGFTNMFELRRIRSSNVHQRLVDLDIPVRYKVVHLSFVSR